MSDTSDGPADQTAIAPRSSRGTFLPLIFGGACACALGFFAGQHEAVEEALGLSDRSALVAEQIADEMGAKLAQQTARLEAQTAQITAQQSQITELTLQLAVLAQAPQQGTAPQLDLAAIEAELRGAVDGKIEQLSGQLAGLSERLAQLDTAPVAAMGSDMKDAINAELTRIAQAAEVQREELAAKAAEMANTSTQTLAALQSQLAAQKDEVAALLGKVRASEEQAAEEAKRNQARAAFTKIIAAAETGAPFDVALAELDASGGAEVPEALRALAADGVPTLASLQEPFADLAREALAAARASDDEAPSSIGAFLQRQLGARSTTPQEGNSADAILSRAEAAVIAGDLGKALAELSELSEAAKAPLASWIETASARHGATEAASDLLTELSTN